MSIDLFCISGQFIRPRSAARKFVLHTSIFPNKVLKTVKLLQEMVNS